MRRCLLTAITALVLLMAACVALGQPERAKDSIVGLREHNFIDLIRDNRLGPQSLAKKQAYLIVRLGASFAQLIVAADSKEDARQLAWALQTGAGGTRSLYSQEDDYAAAEVNLSQARIFSAGHTWDFDLAAVVNSLAKSGWQVFGAVAITKDAAGNISTPEFKHTNTVRDYPLSALLAHPIHLSAQTVFFVFALPFLVAFGPLAALLLGFGLAIWIANQKNISLEIRRKRFAILIRYPIFGAIAICLPISLYAILGGGLTVIADLWFGTASVGMALFPVIAFCMPVILLLIIPMSKLEGRLFSDKADKPDFHPAKSVELMPGSKRRFNTILLSLAMVGLLLQVPTFIFPTHRGPASLVKFAGMMLIIMAGPIAGFVRSRTAGSPPTGMPHDPLLDRVLRLAAVTKSPFATVDVVEPNDQRQVVAVQSMYGRLTISRRAIDELSPTALDFGIAYALVGRTWRFLVPVLIFCIPFAWLMMAVMTNASQLPISPELRPFLVFACMIVLGGSVLPLTVGVHKRESKRQISEALRAVPDRGAGREWFERSMETPPILLPGSEKRFVKNREQTLELFDVVASKSGIA